MKPKLIKVDETFEPIRVAPRRKSNGMQLTGMAGATATFSLWDSNDVKLLDGVAATVELDEDDDTLLTVSFVFTADHWTTIKTAKPDDLVADGYSGHFTVTVGTGEIFFLPKQPGLERIPIKIID